MLFGVGSVGWMAVMRHERWFVVVRSTCAGPDLNGFGSVELGERDNAPPHEPPGLRPERWGPLGAPSRAKPVTPRCGPELDGGRRNDITS